MGLATEVKDALGNQKRLWTGSDGWCRQSRALFDVIMKENIRETLLVSAQVDNPACEDTTLCWVQFQAEPWTHPPLSPSQISRITRPAWMTPLPLVDGALLSALATKATLRTLRRVSVQATCSTAPLFLSPVSHMVC